MEGRKEKEMQDDVNKTETQNKINLAVMCRLIFHLFGIAQVINESAPHCFCAAEASAADWKLQAERSCECCVTKQSMFRCILADSFGMTSKNTISRPVHQASASQARSFYSPLCECFWSGHFGIYRRTSTPRAVPPPPSDAEGHRRSREPALSSSSSVFLIFLCLSLPFLKLPRGSICAWICFDITQNESCSELFHPHPRCGRPQKKQLAFASNSSLSEFVLPTDLSHLSANLVAEKCKPVQSAEWVWICFDSAGLDCCSVMQINPIFASSTILSGKVL